MRSLLPLTFIAFCLSAGTASLAQKKIVMDVFDNTKRETFQDGSKICNTDMKTGIEIHVLKNLQIDSLAMSNGSKFRKINIHHSSTNLDVYQVVDEGSNTTFSLRMFKKTARDTSSKEIQLVIQKCEPEQDETVLIVLKPCSDSEVDKILLTGNRDCKPMTKDNAFGEDIDYYTDKTVIYIYDFNKDPSKRIIWKVYKKNNILAVKPANMSTEVLKPSQQVYFKIVNINRFLYDVAVSDTMITFHSEPSSLFNRLFLGDSTLLGGLITNFSSNKNVAQSSGAQKTSLNNLAENIRCFFKRYNKLQSQMLQAYNPCSDFSCCLPNVDQFYTLANDLLDIKIGMAVVFQDIVKKQQEQLTALKGEVKKCEDTKAKLEQNAKDRKPIEDKPEANRTKEEKETLTNLLKQKEDMEKQYKGCSETELTPKKEQISKLEEGIAYYSAINDLQNKMLPSETDIKKLIVFLQNMVRQNNAYVVGPLTLNGNRLDIDVTIRSKDSVTKFFSLNQYANKLSFQLPVKAKGFISFSTGSFIGIPSRLKNITYEWQQVPNSGNTVLDTAKYVLLRSGYTPPPAGFVALANIEFKLTRDFGIGLSAGVGITIETKPRVAYLGGGSLFFGNLRQFALTGGFAAMQVNKLSNNLQAIADQKIIYSTKQDIKYYDELKLGAFVSLTYTPFKAVKNK